MWGPPKADCDARARFEGSLSRVAEGARAAAVGVVIGIALLFLARTTISGLVYGVSVWDPYIVIGCTAVIVVVCLLSATIPAFRASRISAAEALANTP